MSGGDPQLAPWFSSQEKAEALYQKLERAFSADYVFQAVLEEIVSGIEGSRVHGPQCAWVSLPELFIPLYGECCLSPQTSVCLGKEISINEP